ncbi:MAG: hypothetical protein U0842_11470 [Candidatus Binatia bacterium]
MPAIRRRDLAAYVCGAAVAGTALMIPYAGRALLSVLWPGFVTLDAPFYLLPIVWGAWNVAWVRRGATAPQACGAALGVALATGGNLLTLLRGAWAPSLLLLFAFLPTVYALAWTFVVAPLNEALDRSA